jgi:serine protease Do
LGFYDDPPDFQQPRRRLSIFLVAVISAVIGGLVVLLLTPLLYRSDPAIITDGTSSQFK